MKKIIIVLLLVGIAAFTQSCKILCGKYCRNYQIQQSAVDSVSKVPDENIVITKNELTSFVTKKIVPFYNNTFDILAQKTSLELLLRDANMIKTAEYKDSILDVKIAELIEYHNAKTLLSAKYNKQEIEKAIGLLKDKQFSGTETDKLISLLENYGFIKQDLETLIREINKRKRTPDVDEFIIYAKITESVFKFLYPDDSNNFNMEVFPLIFKICNQILKEKRENLDKDILFLLKEL
ncbi:MAG: hypothetical protein LBU83_08430 [Bacteroidales bacterium]|jgi:hypothetical protein|nr:hypothetical protein [Bacteroidales bacterium]